MAKPRVPKIEEVNVEEMCAALQVEGADHEDGLRAAFSMTEKSRMPRRPKTLRGIATLTKLYREMAQADSIHTVGPRRKLLEMIDEAAMSILSRLKYHGEAHSLWCDLPLNSRASLPAFRRSLDFLTTPSHFEFWLHDCGGPRSEWGQEVLRRASLLYLKDN
ncbi:hypothetical protein KW800_00060 [Candidatus Parcubacteria bacterium]|nr:hypothetical protein [Candidatus Parcubacteria bacterium]